jgi:branched-chain amino acid aminotransferase
MFRLIAFRSMSSIIGFVHEFVSMNNEILSASAGTVRAASASTLYGKGVFTTVAILAGRPFLWEKHWRRLEDNCGRIGIDPHEHTENVVQDALYRLIDKNDFHYGRARITFFDESASELWPYDESNRKTTLLITTADFRPPSTEFKLGISPFRVNSASPLAAVKSCNYLEKLLALEEVRRRGFSEGIQLNERGEVTSACMANIFWLKDGRLFTPSLETGCIPGTTREFVLEELDCDETVVDIGALRSADEIFLTSAGLGVVQAAELDGHPLERRAHPLTDLLPQRH